MAGRKKYRVAVLSDTHGVLRDSVKEILKDCDYILHAGDFDNREIWRELDGLGVLCAVKGNNDAYWPAELPWERRFSIGGFRFFMVHDRRHVPGRLENTDFIIFGHSHRYYCQEEGGSLWLNPGSCGRPRFGGGLSMAVLELEEGGGYCVQRIDLEV